MNEFHQGFSTAAPIYHFANEVIAFISMTGPDKTIHQNDFFLHGENRLSRKYIQKDGVFLLLIRIGEFEVSSKII